MNVTAARLRPKNTPRDERVRLEVSRWGFLPFPCVLFSNLRRPWFVRDRTLDWVRVWLGSRCEKKTLVDTQERAQVPGDKDLENRNTRGGAWSRDFKPWICVFSTASRRAATRLEKSGVGLRVELLLCYFWRLIPDSQGGTGNSI